jgi:octanoyl-[GcvH]:protein N-octanoyltransferase
MNEPGPNQIFDVNASTLVCGVAGQVYEGLRATTDVLASQPLLTAVALNPELGNIVRIYRPVPTLAFSRRESSLPGFAEAVSECGAFGFDPVIRPAGGRAVALDANWFVIDIVTPELGTHGDNREVFRRHGASFVAQLRAWGVDAALGPVEGEYCPGDFSINARKKVKLVGTAQRVVRGARLFSASVPVTISRDVLEILVRVNSLLGLEWKPETLGCLEGEVPGIDPDVVAAGLAATFAGIDPTERTLTDLLAASRVAHGTESKDYV